MTAVSRLCLCDLNDLW